MRKGEAFVGFHEAPINFPPTFKYDVLRTLKGSKTPRGEAKLSKSSTHVPDLSEIGEKLSTDDGSEDSNASDDDEHGDVEAADSVSFASSMWTRTSMQSQRTMDHQDEEEEHYDLPPAVVTPRTPGALNKMFLVHAAQKAKSKWLKLLSSPSLPSTPDPYTEGKTSFLDVNSPTTNRPYHSALQLTPQTPSNKAFRLSPMKRSRSRRSNAVLSATSVATSFEGHDDDHDGRYDSSSKQRVPSWFVSSSPSLPFLGLTNTRTRCDRILWKTTVKGEPEAEEGRVPELRDPSRRRSSVTQFFNQAVRPLRPRTTRDQSFKSAGLSSDPEHPRPPSPVTPGKNELIRVASLNSGATTSASESSDHDSGAPRQGRKLYQSMSIDSAPAKNMLFSWSFPSNVEQSAAQRGRSLSATGPLISAPIPIIPKPDTELNNTPSHSHHPDIMIQTALPSTTPRVSVHKANDTPTKSTPPVRWRLFPFLTRDNDNSAPPTPTSLASETFLPGPRKGDVVPLSYNALDNQAMRRLEGRSDHRPVIGSYAIYI